MAVPSSNVERRGVVFPKAGEELAKEKEKREQGSRISPNLSGSENIRF